MRNPKVVLEVLALVLLFFSIAGTPPPAINEAHYLIKAKNFWEPTFLENDLFVTSGNPHILFYSTVGYLTRWFDLPTVAWICRFAGWFLLAIGLQRLCQKLFDIPFASLVVGIVWLAGIEYANLAGEWVVGGIEAKVFAYGLVLLALSNMVSRRWSATWLLLGTAAAFHVLVGGWSVVAAGAVRCIEWHKSSAADPDKPTAKEWFCLIAGGVISLVGLLPGLAISGRVDGAERDAAARIYVFGRLSHHLAPASFPAEWFFRHGLLITLTVVAGCVLLRHQPQHRDRLGRLLGFCAGAVLLAVAGSLIGLLPAWYPALASNLLRFYWFRMSDAFVPLATGVCVFGILGLPHPSAGAVGFRQMRLASFLAAVAIGAAVILTANRYSQSIAYTPIDPLLSTVSDSPTDISSKETVDQRWRAACQWVAENTSEDAIFITPRHQQTFKWYARRAEVANWKDVPQDTPSLLEWARRINRVYPKEVRRRHPPLAPEALHELSAAYGVDYLMVDRRVVKQNLDLPIVYPLERRESATFVIYKM